MQRTYTKPADSKESRPKTAGEIIIENLKKDGSVIGIEVDGEKWPVEKLCKHDECEYCGVLRVRGGDWGGLDRESSGRR